MNILKRSITFLSIALFCTDTLAQKGLPAKDVITASVTTNYPQHIDFKESMLSSLKVPPGFKVGIAASGLGKPRMMVVSPAGALYITRRDQGDVLMLNDKDGDGKFEELKTVMNEFSGVHGIAIHNGFMYLCANRELKRAKMKPDGTLEEAQLLIKDLPDGGQHPNRTIAFGPDGLLYITVGSTCNDCDDANPENATVLQAAPDGSWRKIYARGLRNTIGIDWHPQTKEFWGMDNGSDMKGEEIPGEELNKIIKEGDYGWPLVYGDKQPDPTREDPPGTTKEEYAQKTQSPALLFPAHSAPINFLFLDKTNYPADYKDDALVTWHGSWNKKNPDGFKVQRIKFENGKPTGAEDFLWGFYNKEERTRFGRPAGLAISPKGVVFISDDANGMIYSVSAK